MFRISSFSLILYALLCSYGTWGEVASEELPTNINAKITEGQTDDTTIPLNQGQETLASHSLDVHTLLQESQSPIVGSSELVLSTPSLQHTATLGGGGVGVPVATEQDAGFVASTVSSLGLSSQSMQGDLLPEREAQQSDVNTDQGEPINSQGGVLENRLVGLNEETAKSTDANPVLSAGTEPVTANYLPDINQLLEQMQHTHRDDAADSISHYLPSSEGNMYTIHTPVSTDTLRLNSPGTSEPTVVGKITVNPQVVEEVVVATQFSPEEADEKHKNGEEEFPTFDKWSMQYLAEQEKQKSVKKQDQIVSASALLLQKKLRQNYAATSCGAKVVASNPEAENVQYLLNRNPDEYMISPCKAKKWFVVELCEPLQIHKVELGSLEMFSSPPKSFRVFASQRYPTKEWISVGKFDMVPERSIQSFTSQPSEEFVKFVRVELLEHYGDEHYCPVSTFRVMGVDMTSDDDDETINEVEETDEETFGEIEEEDIEESVNLFTSAKEIVLKLVNKVLYTEDQQTEDNGKEKPPTANNLTVKAEEQKAKDASCPDHGLPSFVELPTVRIPEAGKVSRSSGPIEQEEVALVTKLADTEQLPTVTFETPVVTRLGEDADSSSWDCAVYSMPDHCVLIDWSKFLHIMAFSHLLSTTCPARSLAVREDKKSSSVTDQWSPVTDAVIEDVASAQTDASEDKQVGHKAVAADAGASSQTETGHRSSPGVKEVHERGYSQASGDPQPVTPSENGARVVPATDLQQTGSDEAALASGATSFTSAGVSAARSEELEPSSLFSHPDMDSVTLSLTTPDLDPQQSQVVEQGAANLAETIFLKVSPSPTLTSEDSVGPDEDTKPEAPTAEHSTDFHVDEHMSKPAFDSSFTQVSAGHAEGPDLETGAEEIKGQMLEKNETGSSVGKTGKSVDLVKVGLSSASKRDTSIMKLSSRIMALEQNVSMAKKYLEELSRAFKQQNEEMMKLLNKTEKKLNVYVSQSEERELKQQTQTDVLEQQVVNLSQLVDTVQLQMNTLGKELRDAQFLLAFVQAVLFLWLMVTSVRGRSKSPLVYTDHQFLLDTMPTKPTIERSDKGNIHRRNSDMGVHSGLMPALKRQVSETNLATGHKQQHSVGGQSQFVRDTGQVPRKRKKRKLKQPQLSIDSASSLPATSNSGIPPAQSASFSSFAGVLFGTDSSYTPAQNSRLQEPYTLTRDILINKSTSQTLNSLTENHNGHTSCSLTSGELGPATLGCSFAHVTRDCLHAGARLSPVKIDETCSVPTSGSFPGCLMIAPTPVSIPSCSLIAPTHGSGPIYSLIAPTPGNDPSCSLIAPRPGNGPSCSLIAPRPASVLVPLELGFGSGAERISSVYLRPNLQGCDLPGAPNTCETAAVLSQSTGPEFHVPVCHSNHMSTLIDNKSSNHSPYATGMAAGFSEADQVIRRQNSLGFINPQVGAQMFLTENSVCKDRFKFPLSIPLADCDRAANRTVFVSDRAVTECKHLAPVCDQLKEHSWNDHYNSTSALATSSSDSTFSGLSSTHSPPHPPSLTSLCDTRQISAVVRSHNPCSLSQLSSISLLAPHRNPAHPTCHSATPTADAEPYATLTCDVGSVVSCEIKACQNVASCEVSSVVTGKVHGGHGVSKSADTSHTHRRQRSLPLHSLRASKSSEKIARPGSCEDDKLQAKLGSSSLQTSSRMKKIKYKTGGVVSYVGSSSNLNAGKKSSI